MGKQNNGKWSNIPSEMHNNITETHPHKFNNEPAPIHLHEIENNASLRESLLSSFDLSNIMDTNMPYGLTINMLNWIYEFVDCHTKKKFNWKKVKHRLSFSSYVTYFQTM